jgi:uncharacterized protein (DUF342 family)
MAKKQKKAKPTKKTKSKVSKKSKSKLKKKSRIHSELSVKDFKEEVPKTVQESLNQIKQEMLAPTQTAQTEIEVRKTPFVLDKVYLQSITFEIASMRQALDRIGQKLDKLEKELAEHRKRGLD